MERLRLGTRSGKIKTIGAMLCLVGALLMTMYKGTSFSLGYHHHPKSMGKRDENRIQGTLFLVGSCMSYAIWYITQVKLFSVLPHKYWATLLTCIVAALQSTLIGVCIDKRPKSWRLGWNLQLVTIFYSGMLATATTFYLVSMAITQKGPTYPSMFNPLSLILIAIIEALFLGEEITVGSLIGMILIVVGLYSFLWGKNKDMKAALPVLKEGTGSGGNSISSGGARDAQGAMVVPAASGD